MFKNAEHFYAFIGYLYFFIWKGLFSSFVHLLTGLFAPVVF